MSRSRLARAAAVAVAALVLAGPAAALPGVALLHPIAKTVTVQKDGGYTLGWDAATFDDLQSLPPYPEGAFYVYRLTVTSYPTGRPDLAVTSHRDYLPCCSYRLPVTVGYHYAVAIRAHEEGWCAFWSGAYLCTSADGLPSVSGFDVVPWSLPW